MDGFLAGYRNRTPTYLSRLNTGMVSRAFNALAPEATDPTIGTPQGVGDTGPLQDTWAVASQPPAPAIQAANPAFPIPPVNPASGLPGRTPRATAFLAARAAAPKDFGLSANLATAARMDRELEESQQKETARLAAERQSSLGPEGFQEFRGANSDPGALFYRLDSPPTNRAYGGPGGGTVSFTPTRGGTVSMSPMGNEAMDDYNARQTIEDADKLFAVRRAQGLAADPFGIGRMQAQYQAQQGYTTQRQAAVDQMYRQAKQEADQRMARGAYTPEQYQQAMQNLERERAFQQEEINPKGGFERFQSTPLG
jgi:hypothetical protein